MIEFAWFYLLKLGIILALLGVIIHPFYKQYKAEGNFFVTSKVPYTLMAVLIIMLVLSPIKLDTGTSADRMRKSYDAPVVHNIQEIETKAEERYEAPSNEDEIKQITEGSNQ